MEEEPIKYPAALPSLPSPEPEFGQITGEMTPAQLMKYTDNQLRFISDRYDTLQQQISDLKDKVANNQTDMVQRIERVLSLMANHMTYLKQMNDIVTAQGDKIDAQAKDAADHELKYVAMVDKQNRLTACFKNLQKTATEIVAELDVLKENDRRHDKFQWKMSLLIISGSTIGAWLLTGDNFARLLLFFGIGQSN